MDVLVPSSIDVATYALRLFAVAAQLWMGVGLARLLGRRGVRSPGLWAAAAALAAVILLVSGDLYRFDVRLLGRDNREPGLFRLVSAVWAIGSCGSFALALVLLAWRRLRRRVLSRRGLVAPAAPPSAAGVVTRRAALAAPFALAGYGVFIERHKFGLSEVDMLVPDLPPGLEGLRIAHLTDIHAGPFLEPKTVRRIVAMVNESKPQLAVITGDLITRPGDPLHETIDALAGLRADSGLWGCMGNHEQFARCRGEAQVYGRGKGIEFLRQDHRELRFGGAELNLVGVDYQRQSKAYLEGAGRWIKPGAVNLLLSHNPDVFPVAANLGYDLILSGHTHGGQITLEIVEQTVNPGRFLTPFVSGLYRIGGSSIYVNRGLGTVTLPMRLGAQPEAAIIRLRKA